MSDNLTVGGFSPLDFQGLARTQALSTGTAGAFTLVPAVRVASRARRGARYCDLGCLVAKTVQGLPRPILKFSSEPLFRRCGEAILSSPLSVLRC